MNWSQAMAAMSKGYKVRGTRWDRKSWISATDQHIYHCEQHDLMGLTYEFFYEQPKKGATKMTPPNISHLPIRNPTIMKLEIGIRELIDKTLEDCENNTCQHISVAELIGLFSILSMDFYRQEFVE